MQTYEVVAKPDALDDLAAIRDHIAHRFGFPSSARSTLRSIKKGLETLGIMRDGCGWSTGSPGPRAGAGLLSGIKLRPRRRLGLFCIEKGAEEQKERAHPEAVDRALAQPAK